ncbi:hypothetical protein [Motilimonas pumila]|uniref:ParB/Sulfiredoxin domain-containing protein n=1 Tax=Motilimonas pumila TaxID=2303987 RepID=A0A418YA53_9GAMM|nr:hypothetical protein [Motilimonas pumila]RJG38985.1 hypothetical protein D1Z90_18605 [Motilimonas pumila]
MLVCLKKLNVESIQPDPGNIRNKENKSFDKIYASLQAHGFDGVLEVVPVGDSFQVKNEGNTRLSILKELYQNTQEDKYATILCLINSASSESNHIMQLIKNEARDGISFHDRVLAIGITIDAYRANHEKLTAKTLSKLLAKQGYKLSETLCYWTLYAFDNVKDTMPRLFQTMGRPSFEHHSKLSQAYVAFMNLVGAQPNDECAIRSSLAKAWSLYDFSSLSAYSNKQALSFLSAHIKEQASEPLLEDVDFISFCLKEMMKAKLRNSDITLYDLRHRFYKDQSADVNLSEIVNQLFEKVSIQSSEAKPVLGMPLGTIITIPSTRLDNQTQAIVWFSVASLLNITGTHLYHQSNEKLIEHIQKLDLADESYRALSSLCSTYPEFIDELSERVYPSSSTLIEQSLLILLTTPSSEEFLESFNFLMSKTRQFKKEVNNGR